MTVCEYDYFFSLCTNDRLFIILYNLSSQIVCVLQIPSLSWSDIILELDNADLIVKERQGLNLLFTAIRLGLQSQGFHHDRFPVDLLYRHWKHADSQVSIYMVV